MKLLQRSVFTLLIVSLPSFAANKTNDSFRKAKKILETDVYQNHRITLYCGASFDAQKNIIPPKGFYTDKYVKRSQKNEWEHVVPAENFGRTFKEWREGDKQCVTSKGKSFKGRKCAEKVNTEYRYMQADMFNLYPAVGAVNGLRSNYNFTMLPNKKSNFGSCEMKIDNRKTEPPVRARGRIARTYMYMEDTYPRYKMNNSQRQLMNAWNKMYPVSEWECMRAGKIAILQGNENLVLKRACSQVRNAQIVAQKNTAIL